MATTEGVFETVFDSCVRGYLQYIPRRTGSGAGRNTPRVRKLGNAHDIFTVKVKKAGVIIVHVPKKISST